MKYLTMTAAALFLLAAPVSGFAQTSGDANAGAGAGAGAGVSTGSGTAADAVQDATGQNDIAKNAVGGENQCSDETATASYDSFSAKCRHQIDAWAMAQSGASAKFEGDIAVGVVVPESVEIVDVPVYHNYGYVMLNDHRVLVDRTSRKVVRVY